MNSPEQHRDQGPKRLRFAVVTVSSSRTLDTDESGRLAAATIQAAGHEVGSRQLVADSEPSILAALEQAIEEDAEAILFTGGTGFSPSDVTPEAILPRLDRTIDGFGELFRSLSFAEIGAAAMLSRAAAGVVGARVVFLLPGSPKAVVLALEHLILPEVGHLLGQLQRSDT